MDSPDLTSSVQAWCVFPWKENGKTHGSEATTPSWAAAEEEEVAATVTQMEEEEEEEEEGVGTTTKVTKAIMVANGAGDDIALSPLCFSLSVAIVKFEFRKKVSIKYAKRFFNRNWQKKSKTFHKECT